MLNRRILTNLAMLSEIGLQPYDGEWWHFDKNNQWDLKLANAIYGSCDLNGIELNSNNTLYEYIQLKNKLVR
jgi:hypothetical protein